MNTKILLSGLMTAMVGVAAATVVEDQTWTLGGGSGIAIPDGNPTGISLATTLSGLDTGLGGAGIDNVNVSLNISGGYNGDLYGYLVFQSADASTTTAILLNRVGRTDAAGFGYGTAGMNVTLSGDTTQSYANINGVATPTSGGTYLADGRVVDPNGNFAGVTSTAGLDGLNMHNPNGTWTLFLADLSGGDQSTLVSWGLNISVVPEPVTWALGIFGGILALGVVGRWQRQARAAEGK